MLDTLDLTRSLSAAAYRRRMSTLRAELRDAQRAVIAAGRPVVVIFEGFDAAGKGDGIAHLVHPLDPRGFKVFTTREPNDEERLRPFLWRFSVKFPARGNFVFFDGSWYRPLLQDRVDGGVRRRDVAAIAAQIRDYERRLVRGGTVLVKLWLHLSRKEQARRLRHMAADRYERWRATGRRGRGRKRAYRKMLAAAEAMLEHTSFVDAPWSLIEAEEPRQRRVRLVEALLAALRQALGLPEGASFAPPAAPVRARRAPRAAGGVARGARARRPAVSSARGPVTALDRVDLGRRLPRREYGRRLPRLQERLRELELECYRQRVPAVIVYEGWDAAGKGGNIKRLTQELDPRGYEVIPIAAPDATERAHHYLWRFWRHVPKAGHIAVFDRSWYGRVLVERVEGFASGTEWRRAYDEINQFERHLADHGTVLVKFWLHISPEEQLRRFRERESVAWKRHKITEDDWRNRAKWTDYRAAVAEMLERTGTRQAPWTIVEANDKPWARVKTLETAIRALEAKLEG